MKESKSFKIFLFSTIDKILDERKLSEKIGLFLIFFQMIQLLSLILNDNNTWLLTYFSKNVLFYFNFPVFYPFLQILDYKIQIFILVFIFLIIFYVIFFFILINRLKKKEVLIYKNYINFFSITINFIDSTLIMPILGILIRFIFCDKNYKITQCFNFEFYVIFFISLILIFTFIFIEIIVGLFFFNFNFKFKKDSFARSLNLNHFIFKIYQILVIILDIFIEENKFNIIIIVHSIFSFILALDYFSRLPFYNPKISEIYSYGIYIYFWNNIVFLITNLVNSKLLIDNLWLIIPLGSFFFIWISKTYKEYFYRGLITKDIKKIKNEIHLDVRLRYLLNIIKNSKKNKESELLMTSFLKVHFDKCLNKNCLCKNKKELYDPKKMLTSNNLNIFKDYVYIKSFMKKEIKNSIKINESYNLIILDYFIFLFSELEHISWLNHEILNFEKKKNQEISSTLEYCLYRIKNKIKNLLKKKNKTNVISKVKFEEIRKYDKIIYEIKNLIILITENYSKLWEILNDSFSNFSKIKEILSELYIQRKKILKLYKTLSKNKKNKSNEFFILMIVYFKNIIFDDIQILGLLNLMEEFYFDNEKLIYIYDNITYINNLNIFGKDVCSIEISMNLENIGQILWCSKNIENVFQYQFHFLKNTKIEIWMPKIISDIHQEILKNFFKTYKIKLFNIVNYFWGIDKSGNLFKMNSIFKLFFYKNSFNVLSLNQKIDIDNYLLCNNMGEFDSLGLNFQKLLEINNIFLKDKGNLNIILFIPKLIPLFLPHVFGIKDFKFDNYDYNELKNCLIMIPIDFKVIINSLNLKLIEAKLLYKEDYLEEYFKILYKCLINIKSEDIIKAYYINIKYKIIPIYKNKIKILEIKLNDYYEYTNFNKEIFNSERIFIDFISFMNTIKISINKYKDHLKTKKNNEIWINKNENDKININLQENIKKLRKNKKLTLLKNTNEIENNNMLKNMLALKEKYENISSIKNIPIDNKIENVKPKKGVFVGLANLLLGNNINKVKKQNNNKFNIIMDKLNSLKKGEEENLVNLKLNILTNELLENKIDYEFNYDNNIQSLSYNEEIDSKNFEGKEENVKLSIIDNIKKNIIEKNEFLESDYSSLKKNQNIFNKFINYCSELKIFIKKLKKGKQPRRLKFSKYFLFFIFSIVISGIIFFYFFYKDKYNYLIQFNEDSLEFSNIQNQIIYWINFKFIEKINFNNNYINEIIKFKPIIYNEFKDNFRNILEKNINSQKNYKYFDKYYLNQDEWNVIDSNRNVIYLNFLSNFLNYYDNENDLKNINNLKIINKNYYFYNELIADLNVYIKNFLRYVRFESLGFFLIFSISFWLVYYLIINSLKIIQETLDLLTKIDQNIILFYNYYFKKWLINIKNIKNHKIKINQFIDFDTKFKKKSKNINNFRLYKKKKINLNKFKLFSSFFKIFLICLILIGLKNILKIIFLNNIKDHMLFYINYQFWPSFITNYFISTNNILTNNSNVLLYKNFYEKIIKEIENINKIENLYFLEDFKIYIKNIINNDNCNLINKYPCNDISRTLFKNSFLVYWSKQLLNLKIIENYYKNLDNNQIENLIKNQYLFYWYYRINYNYLTNFKNDINLFIKRTENIEFYLMLSIIFIYLIMLLLTFIYLFKKIEKNLKDGFKYILLLPYKCYKTNQYFLIFMKKRLNINKLT